MNTDTEGLLDKTATCRAHLRCVARVHRDPPTTSLRSFVVEEREELRPTCIADALGNVAAGQPLDVQDFCNDHRVCINQRPAELVLEVEPPVPDTLVMLADQAAELPVLAAAPLAAGAALLEHGQPLLARPEPARVIDFLARREGDKRQQTHVEADRFQRAGQGFGVGQLKLEDDAPVAQPVALDDSLPDNGSLRQRAVPEQADAAHMLHVQATVTEMQAIAVDVAHGVEAAAPFVARIARRLPGLDAAKEGGIGFVEAAERLLDRTVVQPRGVGIKLADRLKLAGLRSVVDALAALLPRQAALGEGVVVQAPVYPENAIQRLTLFVGRIQAVLVREIHLCLKTVAPQAGGLAERRPCRWGHDHKNRLRASVSQQPQYTTF